MKEAPKLEDHKSASAERLPKEQSKSPSQIITDKIAQLGSMNLPDRLANTVVIADNHEKVDSVAITQKKASGAEFSFGEHSQLQIEEAPPKHEKSPDVSSFGGFPKQSVSPKGYLKRPSILKNSVGS